MLSAAEGSTIGQQTPVPSVQPTQTADYRTSGTEQAYILWIYRSKASDIHASGLRRTTITGR